MQSYSTLILIAIMVFAFYFLILRPQRRRQQAQQRTLSALTPGTRVVTTAGVYATIVEIGPRQAVLETSPGAYLTILKQAITRVAAPEEEDAELAGYADELDESDDLGSDDLDAQLDEVDALTLPDDSTHSANSSGASAVSGDGVRDATQRYSLPEAESGRRSEDR